MTDKEGIQVLKKFFPKRWHAPCAVFFSWAIFWLSIGDLPLRAGEQWDFQPTGKEAAGAKDKSFADRLFNFYQSHISSKDGPRCPFYPTCSAFGLYAVKKHGPVKGLFMTTDRLMREYPGMHETDNYPVMKRHDAVRLYDPVR